MDGETSQVQLDVDVVSQSGMRTESILTNILVLEVWELPSLMCSSIE